MARPCRPTAEGGLINGATGTDRAPGRPTADGGLLDGATGTDRAPSRAGSLDPCGLAGWPGAYRFTLFTDWRMMLTIM